MLAVTLDFSPVINYKLFNKKWHKNIEIFDPLVTINDNKFDFSSMTLMKKLCQIAIVSLYDGS